MSGRSSAHDILSVFPPSIWKQEKQQQMLKITTFYFTFFYLFCVSFVEHKVTVFISFLDLVLFILHLKPMQHEHAEILEAYPTIFVPIIFVEEPVNVLGRNLHTIHLKLLVALLKLIPIQPT